MEVGNTPLVEVDGIFAKLECANPTGSVKDRMVSYIINRSRELDLLTPGETMIEATSGNTGIALSYFGTRAGHKVLIVMPEDMSEERRKLIRDYGGDLVLTEDNGKNRFRIAKARRDELAEQHGYFRPMQFSNPLNPECHYETTGVEIVEQMGDAIDAFCAGVGTGGTLVGIGRRLKMISRGRVHVAGVEPYECPTMSNGEKHAGVHCVQGIADGFNPPIILNGDGGLHSVIDDVILEHEGEAVEAAKYLSRKGHHVGISSGINFLAALKLKKRFERVVTIFPDTSSRYVSMGLKACQPQTCSHRDNCVTTV